MSEKIITLLIKKLGLQDESGLYNKATELLRLLDIKSSQLSFNINDYGKIVILIDLAAASLGIPFENVEEALHISGLKKSAYQNHKRTFEKMLDINKYISINDMCTQLGVNEIAHISNNILQVYKNSDDVQNSKIDITHPQYASMAIYLGCKIREIKLSKHKLLQYSHLKISQWTQLEKHWQDVLRKIGKKELEKLILKTDYNSENKTPIRNITNVETNIMSPDKVEETEDYETWKTRMLTKAFKKYLETKNINITNFVLPSIEEIRNNLSPRRFENMDES